MARRPEGVQSFCNETQGESVIKEAPGILYAVNISWTGATAGDEIILRDGNSNQGRIIFRFRAPAKFFHRYQLLDQPLLFDEEIAQHSFLKKMF
jgi:hypothetical protein